MKPEDFILYAKQEQEINEAFIGAIFDTSEAASPNAQANLDKKLRGLEDAYKRAVKVYHLPDGRVRYYTKESPSVTPGPTRGASYVTEHNLKQDKFVVGMNVMIKMEMLIGFIRNL